MPVTESLFLEECKDRMSGSHSSEGGSNGGKNKRQKLFPFFKNGFYHNQGLWLRTKKCVQVQRQTDTSGR